MISNAVAALADYDTDVDGFDDWLWQGSWNAVTSFDAAFAQIEEAAQNWDNLCYDSELAD